MPAPSFLYTGGAGYAGRRAADAALCESARYHSSREPEPFTANRARHLARVELVSAQRFSLIPDFVWNQLHGNELTDAIDAGYCIDAQCILARGSLRQLNSSAVQVGYIVRGE